MMVMTKSTDRSFFTYVHTQQLLGMNPNIRQFGNHVEFDSKSFYAAFVAEIECSGTSMWMLAQKCTDQVRLDVRAVILSASQRPAYAGELTANNVSIGSVDVWAGGPFGVYMPRYLSV